MKFPRADDDGFAKGWELDYDFLEDIYDELESEMCNVSLQDIEDILLATERVAKGRKSLGKK